MKGRSKEYSELEGWYVFRIVNKQRFENSVPRHRAYRPEDDPAEESQLTYNERFGIPEKDLHTGETVRRNPY